MTTLSRRIAAIACGFAMTMFAGTPTLAQEAAVAAPAMEDAQLAAFFEEVFQRGLKDRPMFQSQLGMKGPDYGKWNDFSDAEAERQNALTRQDLARLRAEFAYDRLSEAMQVSYRIFEAQHPCAIVGGHDVGGRLRREGREGRGGRQSKAAPG